MTLSTESQKTIDTYLAALRKQLRELTDEDARDIAEEIRIHILDKTAESASPETIAGTLTALGTPAELANKYCTEEMLKRAQAAHSPAYIARRLRRWALLTLSGIAIFALSLIGYVLGGGLFILGVLKIDNPGKTGIFGQWNEHNKSFNFQSGGPNGPHELLGWWLVPIGLIVGGGLLLLTFRFDNWSIRKFWPPRRPQEF